MYNHADAQLLTELKTGQKRWQLSVDIKRFYTNVDGVLLDKAVVPAKFKVAMPVFLLGEFDRQGGYRQGLQACPPNGGLVYMTSFVNGVGFATHSIIGFTGLDQIKDQILPGDICHVFTDSLLLPSIFVWIVQQNSFVSLGSILSNFSSEQKDGRLGQIRLKDCLFHATSNGVAIVDQFSQDWFMVSTDNIGDTHENQIHPAVYISPETYQTGFVKMKLNFDFTQYLGINFYMAFATDLITINFNLNQ